jgi:hypothetical protein
MIMVTLEKIKESLNEDNTIPKENRELIIEIINFFKKDSTIIKFRSNTDKEFYYVNDICLDTKKENLYFVGTNNLRSSSRELFIYNLFNDFIKDIKNNFRFCDIVVKDDFLPKIKKVNNSPLINLDLED